LETLYENSPIQSSSPLAFLQAYVHILPSTSFFEVPVALHIHSEDATNC